MVQFQFSDSAYVEVLVPKESKVTKFEPSDGIIGVGVIPTVFPLTKFLHNGSTTWNQFVDLDYFSDPRSSISTNGETRWPYYHDCDELKLNGKIHLTYSSSQIVQLPSEFQSFSKSYQYIVPKWGTPSGTIAEGGPYQGDECWCDVHGSSRLLSPCYVGYCGISGSSQGFGYTFVYPRLWCYVIWEDKITHKHYITNATLDSCPSPESYNIRWPGQATSCPVTLSGCFNYISHLSTIGVSDASVFKGSFSNDAVRLVESWSKSLSAKNLFTSMRREISCRSSWGPLTRLCYQSFRVKNATLLREMIDTMSDLAGLSGAKALDRALRDKLKTDFLKRNWSNYFRDFSHLSADKFLEVKYGVELPLKTAYQHGKVYGDNLFFQHKTFEELFPSALRARKGFSFSLETYQDAPETRFNGYQTLCLGIGNSSPGEDFLNLMYRWGGLLSIADGWELIPLSFVVDWLYSGFKNRAQELTDFIDSYRLNVRYSCKSTAGSVGIRLPLPRTDPWSVQCVVLEGRYYSRRYSTEIPRVNLGEAIQQDSPAGTLTINSIPSLAALLVSFLT